MTLCLVGDFEMGDNQFQSYLQFFKISFTFTLLLQMYIIRPSILQYFSLGDLVVSEIQL